MSNFQRAKIGLTLASSHQLNSFACSWTNPMNAAGPEASGPAIHGFMFLTEQEILFRSATFSTAGRILLSLEKVTEVKKENFVFRLQKSIIIVVDTCRYEFSGFNDRNSAFQCILTLRRNAISKREMIGTRNKSGMKNPNNRSDTFQTYFPPYENVDYHLAEHDQEVEEETKSCRNSPKANSRLKLDHSPVRVSKQLSFEFSGGRKKSPRARPHLEVSESLRH